MTWIPSSVPLTPSLQQHEYPQSALVLREACEPMPHCFAADKGLIQLSATAMQPLPRVLTSVRRSSAAWVLDPGPELDQAELRARKPHPYTGTANL